MLGYTLYTKQKKLFTLGSYMFPEITSSLRVRDLSNYGPIVLASNFISRKKGFVVYYASVLFIYLFIFFFNYIL